MFVNFVCPFCKTNLKVPDSGAGRKVRCPRCGTAVRVPTDNGATESAIARRSGPPNAR